MYIFALLLLTSIVAFRISNSAEAGKSIVEETAEFFVWDMVITLINSYGNDESFRFGLDFIPKQLLLFCYCSNCATFYYYWNYYIYYSVYYDVFDF